MSRLHKPIVRAIDVGYGHVKFTDGEDGASIRYDSFPSQSPPAQEQTLGGGALHRRDTFRVQSAGRVFEVGKAVALAMDAHQETEILDKDFCLSPSYAARLYGALNYMLPNLPVDRVIDRLVLGLPMSTYYAHAASLTKRFEGTHRINTSGEMVTVNACSVFPQPLGAYADFLPEGAARFRTSKKGKSPMALVIDPGYNTVDWFVCQGMTAIEKRSGATMRGMSSVLRAIAEKLIFEVVPDATVSAVVRRLDAALASDDVFTLAGKEITIESYLTAGSALIEEAAQAIKNSVGSPIDIDVIVVAGGGARLYTSAIAAKFPAHQVITLAQPAFANVRGFHLIGQRLTESAQRAIGSVI